MTTETYGVFGKGFSTAKVITEALKDIGTNVHYVLPWYGPPTAGLETVYDWMLENEVEFSIVGTKIPKALTRLAESIIECAAEEVDDTIQETLVKRSGIATILWEEDEAFNMVALAGGLIDAKLPVLELTNGLIPIILDEPEEVAPEPEVEKPQPQVDDEKEFSASDEEVEKFDRPTLENMPAAIVKRMAQDKGFDVKTKEQAIVLLTEEQPAPATTAPERHIVSVVVTYSDGMIMTL